MEKHPESKGEISDTLARFSTFNSAQIPSPTIPTYSSLLQADSLTFTDNKYIDPDYIIHTLTIEASRIGIDGDFGEIGQVLGKDEDNNPAWTDLLKKLPRVPPLSPHQTIFPGIALQIPQVPFHPAWLPLLRLSFRFFEQA